MIRIIQLQVEVDAPDTKTPEWETAVDAVVARHEAEISRELTKVSKRITQGKSGKRRRRVVADIE